ncbi:MAG TPA: hypothetical protein ACHBX0_06080 [Arsenophonus sp.]
MYKVITATANPAKINTINLAFQAVFGAGNYQINSIIVSSNTTTSTYYP